MKAPIDLIVFNQNHARIFFAVIAKKLTRKVTIETIFCHTL